MRRFGTALVKYAPEILAVVIPLLYCASFIAPARNLPPDKVFMGFVHPDQAVYYATAREAFENGNGFVYASPYSNLPDSPRIYSHFCFLAIGYFWKLTGIPLPALDYLFRAVFGIAMMLLIVRVMRAALPPGAPVLFGAIAVISCSGIAWAISGAQFIQDHFFMGAGPPSLEDYVVAFRQTESGYGEWYLNVFGNLTFVHELMFHVLFFGAALAIVRGRAWLAVFLLFLTWWSHPYTGLQLGLISGSFFLVEALLGRRAAFKPFAAAALITLAFIAYYLLWLPRFPEHASVFEQMKKHSMPMLFSKLLPAYGLFLALPLFLFVKPRFRAFLKGSAAARLMLIWLLVTAFLIFHDRLLFFVKPFQPMHFTRGYLFVPLVYFSTCAMGALKQEHNWSPRKYAILLSALLLVQLPDNLIRTAYLHAQVVDPLFFYQIYAVPRGVTDLLKKMDSVEPTLTIHAPGMPEVNKWITVLTHHRAVLGHLYNVPYRHEKSALLETEGRALDLDVVRKLKIDALIVPEMYLTLLRESLKPADCRVAFTQNGMCMVIVKKPFRD